MRALAGVLAGMPPIQTFISNKLLAVLTFLIVKMVMQGQQLVKPVVCT